MDRNDRSGQEPARVRLGDCKASGRGARRHNPQDRFIFFKGVPPLAGEAYILVIMSRYNHARLCALFPRRKRLMPTKKKAAKATSTPIDPYVATLLEKISEGKQVLRLPKGEKIFAQGDSADAIFFIQSGKVKISVVSAAGKEAVLVIIGPQNFFGEGSLVGQSLRMSTATTLEPSTVFRVEKLAVIRALHDQALLSEK